MADTTFEVDRDNLQVTITRVFKATPERLWKAYTDPADIVQWWQNTEVDKLDVRVGGAWRFVSYGQDGQEHGFRGEFTEVDEPRKLTRTFEYEPYPGKVMTESVTLQAQADGTTLMTTTSKYQDISHLEGMVGSGMERGSKSGLDRLAHLVESS